MTPKQIERCDRIREMREGGVSFATIGGAFGISASRASDLYRHAKRIEEFRRLRASAAEAAVGYSLD